MTKWEYKWMTWDIYKNTQVLLDELGEKGWELVTVFDDEQQFVAFFKRPKTYV